MKITKRPNFEGKLKIRVISDKIAPKNRWLVWDRNILHDSFYNYLGMCGDNYQEYYKEHPERIIETLFCDMEDEIKIDTRFNDSDTPSKLNFAEYFLIMNALLKTKHKYNKKKDILI